MAASTPRIHRTALTLAAICILAHESLAIAAPPVIGNLSLRRLQIGATTTLVIDGADLMPQPQLMLPAPIAKQTVHPGGTANHVEIDVTLEGNVTPGIDHLRVSTPGGISGAVAVGMDTLPQRPIGTATTPLPAADLPAALSGSLAGGQTANTVVALKRDQQLVIEVEARRLASALDPVIHVYDSRGVPLAWAEGASALGGDARLTFTAPADGNYRVELHDAVYQAGNPGFYRLKIGSWYYAGMVFPPVMQRGTKATLAFAATNLPAGAKVDIDMPANSSDMPAPWPAGMQVAGFRPVVLASDVQETVQSPAAKEAANATAKGAADASLQQIVAPAGFSGRLTAAKEDQLRVAVEPNERLRFEVLAARIGSPVDCVLSIRDEHGNQLASNDDQPGTTDPGLDFNVPGNSHAVVVAIKDVTGRGGPDCIYHLAVSRLDRPDFALSLVDDRGEIPPGGMGLLRVLARRTDYNGPIDLSFQGLPVGVTAKDAVIDAGTDEALVSLVSADGTHGRGNCHRCRHGDRRWSENRSHRRIAGDGRDVMAAVAPIGICRGANRVAGNRRGTGQSAQRPDVQAGRESAAGGESQSRRGRRRRCFQRRRAFVACQHAAVARKEDPRQRQEKIPAEGSRRSQASIAIGQRTDDCGGANRRDGSTADPRRYATLGI